MPFFTRSRTIVVSSCILAGLLACKAASHREGTTAATPAAGGAPAAAAGSTAPDVFMGHLDPAKFGIPLYPGAKQSSEGGGIASTGSEGNSEVLVLTTADSYDKVVAWYKARLPAETGNLSVPGISTMTFRAGPKDATDGKFATVATLNGQTSITLSAGHQSPAAATSKGAPTSGGTLADLSATGLPLYPNVFESAWTGNFSNDKEGARIGQMSSHDSFDKVYAWYKEHMAAGTESPEAAASNHTGDDGERMAMFQTGETSDAKMSRVMLIRGKSDEYTTISLASHVTK